MFLSDGPIPYTDHLTRPQESFWSTLKTEYYERCRFDTHAEAITGVSTWIEQVYNRARRHSALGQISPRSLRTPTRHRGRPGRLNRCPPNGVNPIKSKLSISERLLDDTRIDWSPDLSDAPHISQPALTA